MPNEYELFGRSDDRKLGDERRASIAAAVQKLRGEPDLGPLMRDALGRYEPPLDAIV